MGPPLDLGRALPSPAMITPNHTASIHLWQFLKELLLQPEAYSHCIRWIDREKAIFKIEDSVEVARLWGIRKNRPAMNYDKLSRSIRQYYKKGIIRKTEISQRLVYQFVKPV
ncbi:SAM pointed domain-containing Ets transcription factor-like [Petromyzon marinus]|uniref:SAM pointed domain-containing Ets transcription factor-like n=3 Tax=Petromyzontidae TaxID=7746 RepID=A0AAJ7STF5_PETMA|nr:SAM pointed domain-containing Ets transcription factor-like [Petromyzon marinus]